MARMKSPAPLIPSNSLVASAVRYPGQSSSLWRPSEEWQRECYRHFHICGEARFAANFFGNALSRCVLNISQVDEFGKLVVVNEGAGFDALQNLFNGRDGQSQMLKAIGMHFTIAGECYLVGRTDQKSKEEIWEIVSVMEMRQSGGNWSIRYDESIADIQLTKKDVVIRMWMPSPDHRIQADSPFRSLLPTLREIEWLTSHIFAQITSRLVNAGILLMPQGMTFPKPEAVEGKEIEFANDADAFMQVLGDVMMEAIQDPSSPKSRIPIVATVPDETIDKPRLLEFWSQLDEVSKSMREDAIRRFALGMDMPPEQILGMSGSGKGGGGNSISHWGAWQIEEATIKMHVEPMLETIANSVTVGYIRPMLEDELSSSDQVGYDSTSLRLRPDKSAQALELYDRGELKSSSLLRECNFDPEDSPDDDEFKNWLLRRVASGSAQPEQVGAALKALGVDLGIQYPDSGQAPNEARPTPSLEDHPVRPKTPETGPSASLVAASEGLVFRALERAGNRLRGKGVQPPNIPAYETHCHVKANGQASTLFTDFNSYASLVLEGVAEVEATTELLESYCNMLILEQSPHNRERLTTWLAMGGK